MSILDLAQEMIRLHCKRFYIWRPLAPRADLRSRAPRALNKSSEREIFSNTFVCHPRADWLRSTSATPVEGFKRKATIVSAELDDEAAVIISSCRASRRHAPPRRCANTFASLYAYELAPP